MTDRIGEFVTARGFECGLATWRRRVVGSGCVAVAAAPDDRRYEDAQRMCMGLRARSSGWLGPRAGVKAAAGDGRRPGVRGRRVGIY